MLIAYACVENKLYSNTVATYVGTHIHTCKHGGHEFTKSRSTGNLHFPVIRLEEMFKLHVIRLRV